MSPRKSTIGRPRALTDEEVAIVMQWHRAVLAWKSQRGTLKTLQQLAKELGVAPATVYNAIRLGGEYKTAEPERGDASTRGATARKGPRS